VLNDVSDCRFEAIAMITMGITARDMAGKREVRRGQGQISGRVSAHEDEYSVLQLIPSP
jgi:hypothetical protein